jgi:hypothetical protein
MTPPIATGRMRHRPFATSLSPTAADTTLSTSTVQAEIRALAGRGALTRPEGDDLLARPGRRTLPYRRAVAVSVPNDRYTAPSDPPTRQSLRAPTSRRFEACPGYQAGGIYRAGAEALPAVMATADGPDTAHAAAETWLPADLAALTDIRADPPRMRPVGSPLLAGLDQPATAPPAPRQEPSAPIRRPGGDRR